MANGTTSRALLAFAGLALLGGGCAGRRGPVGPGEPGTTTILVENHVSSPDELDRLQVTIDDAIVPLSTIPPRDEQPTALPALRLPPGPHTISVRATAHGAEDDRVVVAAAQIFHVAAAPAAIGIAVRSRAGGSLSDDGRIAVDLSMKGGHLNPELGAPQPETAEERCAPLQPVPRALCRAAGDLDDATRRNDLVSVLCVRDKLATMRHDAQIAETSRGEAAAMAEKRVLAMGQEVERCRRSDVIGGQDGLTVIKR